MKDGYPEKEFQDNPPRHESAPVRTGIESARHGALLIERAAVFRGVLRQPGKPAVLQDALLLGEMRLKQLTQARKQWAKLSHRGPASPKLMGLRQQVEYRPVLLVENWDAYRKVFAPSQHAC